jgi:hypothetical protein
MQTSLSSNNPFSYDRYGYAFEHLADKSKCLDYGCYDAMFLHKCKEKKELNYIGIDKNKDIVFQNPYNEQIFAFEDKIPFLWKIIPNKLRLTNARKFGVSDLFCKAKKI